MEQDCAASTFYNPAKCGCDVRAGAAGSLMAPRKLFPIGTCILVALINVLNKIKKTIRNYVLLNIWETSRKTH